MLAINKNEMKSAASVLMKMEMNKTGMSSAVKNIEMTLYKIADRIQRARRTKM